MEFVDLSLQDRNGCPEFSSGPVLIFYFGLRGVGAALHERPFGLREILLRERSVMRVVATPSLSLPELVFLGCAVSIHSKPKLSNPCIRRLVIRHIFPSSSNLSSFP